MKLRSLILNIKSDAQKQMIKFGFGRRFHDINYFEVMIFYIFLEFIISLKASSQNFVENHQFYGILSCFKQILERHLFNITYLHTTYTIF